jgi:hypothetical protein
MASMWLPLVRYAEDQAHQVGDDTQFYYPHAYLYRDWVIAAFNRDLPYDRFVRLQLAADRYLARPDPATPANTSDLPALGLLGLGPKYYDRQRLDVMTDEWSDRVDTVSRTLLGLTVSCARCHDHKFEPITTRDYYALAGVFASTRMVNLRPDGQPEKDGIKADKMDPGTVHVVTDGTPRNLTVFYRGSVEQKGPEAPRRFLRILCDGEPRPFEDGSGRRELAEAIACPANPLTARVMVNRVWAVMFGQPLERTPSNFGHSGALPSDHALLDDLAVRFVEGGWSVKALVRDIALSATYRQSSLTAGGADPSNTLCGRMNRRRLTVEQWRDALLSVTGELRWDGTTSMELTDPSNRRRTVYARISRLHLDDLLAQFDYPDANVHSDKRAVTTTAIQKLFMLNSPFMLDRARALAARLAADCPADGASRIQRAYTLLYGRPADTVELRIGLDFIRRPASGTMTRWEQYGQALLASNEFMYED